MLFYLLNDLVSVTRFFAEQRQDDELKISRGEPFRDPHPRSTQEARGKVTVASSPAPAVTAMTAGFKRSNIAMSMHVTLLELHNISYMYIVRYVLSQGLCARSSGMHVSAKS